MSGTDRALAAAGCVAAGCSALYGAMKLAHAFGAAFLADKSPLPLELRARLLDRDPLFVASHWLLAGLALLGVVVALATVRPWGRAAYRWILAGTCWGLAAVMLLRAVGASGFGFVGGTLALTGASGSWAELSPLLCDLVLWDLALWSPFFLVWGTSWLLAGWHVVRPRRAVPA